MIVVDSSGWLEYFLGRPNASVFQPAIEDTDSLLVPSITIYEVYRRLARGGREHDAKLAIAQMTQPTIVDVDERIAIRGAMLGISEGLPMADAIILATARHYRAELWTQDADFEGMEGVRYVEAR